MRKIIFLICLNLTLNIYSQNVTEKLNGSRTKTENKKIEKGKQQLFDSFQVSTNFGSLFQVWTEKNSIALFKDIELKELLIYKNKADISYRNSIVVDIRKGNNCDYIFNVLFRNGDIGWIKSCDLQYNLIDISWAKMLLNDSYYKKNEISYNRIKEIYSYYQTPNSLKHNSLINKENKRKFNIEKIFFDCNSPVNEITNNGNKIYLNGNQINKVIFKEKNILTIELTKDNKIIIEGVHTLIKDVKEKVIRFLDNGGGVGKNYKPCDYCRGERSEKSSDHPDKAYIIIANRNNFDFFKLQQNPTGIYTKIRLAYDELSNRLYRELNGTSKKFSNLDCKSKDVFRNKYYPINIIYNDNYKKTKNDNTKELPIPSPISVVGDNIEVAEGIKKKNVKVNNNNERISFMTIEKKPVFPGCNDNQEEIKDCFSKSIQNHILKEFDKELPNKLGLSSGRKRIQIGFNIDEKGNVINVNARAPHPKIKNEIIRVIKQLPKMKPGSQNGKNRIVRYSIPYTIEVK